MARLGPWPLVPCISISQEFCGIYVESFRQLADGTELRLRVVAFYVDDGAVTNLGLFSQLFLGQEPSGSDLLQLFPDVDHDGHCSRLSSSVFNTISLT